MLGTLDLDLIELLFQRAKQTLNSAVLPWAMHSDALVTDASALQALAEDGAGEARLVVSANATRLTVFRHCLLDMSDEKRALLTRGYEAEQPSAAMIDDAENVMKLAGLIYFSAEIHAPYLIDTAHAGNVAANIST